MNPREMCTLIEAATNDSELAQRLLHLRFFGNLYEQRLVKSGLAEHGLRLDWDSQLTATVKEAK
jgi:hypothetical protein